VASNCVISGILSFGVSGDVYGGTLNNCTLSNNVAILGGSVAYGCSLNNCTLSRNIASGGAVAYDCSLRNCALIGNLGGLSYAASHSVLNNCTLSGNSGGVADGCTLTNCIAYFNAGANYDGSCTLDHCCTTPAPSNGLSNITNAPLFVDTNEWSNLRLQSNSPCINAGNNAYVVGETDLDGNARMVRGIVDIGAYESQLGVHYVDVNSTNATPPYTNWATAATNIQDAVDAAVAGDDVVVTNGLYATGGRDLNRVKVDKSLSVSSVNGPQLTTIVGALNRCAYLTNSTTLSGFTLTNGSAYVGGGVYCESPTAVVSNCVIVGSLAQRSGGGAYGGRLNNCMLVGNVANDLYGGGAYNCTLNDCTLDGNGAQSGGGGAGTSTLNNCTLSDNLTDGFGGGVYRSTLNNCTLVGNLADGGAGGGASDSALTNCIVYYNTPDNDNYFETHCCTTPLPKNGFGNITNAPLFVDTNGWANLRLQSNSPCINAGNNAFAPSGPDLDGNQRIAGGTADIGAYEFQGPVSNISYAWLQQFGLPINALTDAADPDGDGVDNYHEWLAHSDPTNPFSFAPLLTMIRYGENVIFTWPTNAVGFTLQSTTNLGLPAVWSTNCPAPVVIGGLNTVTNPLSSPQQFYRLRQ
jgi:hypothetical protein